MPRKKTKRYDFVVEVVGSLNLDGCSFRCFGAALGHTDGVGAHKKMISQGIVVDDRLFHYRYFHRQHYHLSHLFSRRACSSLCWVHHFVRFLVKLYG